MTDQRSINEQGLGKPRLSPCDLVYRVLYKCQSEINSRGEKRATVEMIVQRDVQGYGILVRSQSPQSTERPSSIWFFPETELVAIETCIASKTQSLDYFDADDLDERFIWEHISHFIRHLS